MTRCALRGCLVTARGPARNIGLSGDRAAVRLFAPEVPVRVGFGLGGAGGVVLLFAPGLPVRVGLGPAGDRAAVLLFAPELPVRVGLGVGGDGAGVLLFAPGLPVQASLGPRLCPAIGLGSASPPPRSGAGRAGALMGGRRR